ncbi:MAG: hypothetical protein KDD40_05010, partial [Bdellovibrionales bacterium]|nr:hypothetical protein [Bdellovibrionales bacterium]
MKFFASIFMLCSALVVMTTACAPKDKRFQSKTFVNKGPLKLNKKDKTDKDKSIKSANRVDKAEVNAVSEQNPSGITDTKVFVKLNNLNIGSLADATGTNDLQLNIHIRIIKADDADMFTELVMLPLPAVAETTKSVNINEVLELSRDKINSELKKLKEIANTSDLKMEISLSQQYVDGDNTIESAKIMAKTIDLKEIKAQAAEIEIHSDSHSRDPEGDAVENVQLTLSIYSEGKYTITQGMIAEQGTLICAFNDRSGKLSQMVELSTQKIIIADESVVLDNYDFTMSSTQQSLITSTISEDKNSETFVAIDDQDEAIKTSLVITKGENCSVGSGEINNTAFNANLNIVNSVVANSLYGCCIEK